MFYFFFFFHLLGVKKNDSNTVNTSWNVHNDKMWFCMRCLVPQHPIPLHGSFKCLWSLSWNKEPTVTEGSADKAVGKGGRLPLLLQTGTHSWQYRGGDGQVEFGFSTFLSFPYSLNCLAFTVIDWLIPLMNSSSYQSSWRPREPRCSRQERLGEMSTYIRLYLKWLIKEPSDSMFTLNISAWSRVYSWVREHQSACLSVCGDTQRHALWLQFTVLSQECFCLKLLSSLITHDLQLTKALPW